MAAIRELGYIGTHSTDGSECLGSYSTTSPSSGLFLGDDDDELDDAMVQVSQKHRSTSKRAKLSQYQVGRVLEVGAAHLTKSPLITWSLEAHSTTVLSTQPCAQPPHRAAPGLEKPWQR